MGVSVSRTTSQMKRQHRAVEQAMSIAKAKNRKVFKLLLLGASNAGKSTIVKQMRILHGTGFAAEELGHQRNLIYENIIHSLAAIIRAMREFGINFDNEDRQADADHALALVKIWGDTQCIHPHDWMCLKNLWIDPGVQLCFQRSNEYQLPCSTTYFCDNLDRISATDYKPTNKDMLHSRANTSGIVELEFTLRGLTLKVIDVGGQRSQRKKWIHCFENINAVIYVAAISEYNQVLMEDSNVNRLFESIKLFSMIINSRWFVETSLVLFLNKKDLFEEKLKLYPLSYTFPRFTGGQDYQQACDYILRRFHRENKNPQKSVYTHITCATDTNNIRFVLESSLDILLKNALSLSERYHCIDNGLFYAMATADSNIAAGAGRGQNQSLKRSVNRG